MCCHASLCPAVTGSLVLLLLLPRLVPLRGFLLPVTLPDHVLLHRIVVAEGQDRSLGIDTGDL